MPDISIQTESVSATIKLKFGVILAVFVIIGGCCVVLFYYFIWTGLFGIWLAFCLFKGV